MIKLFFLIIFLLTGSYALKADEGLGNDPEFMRTLDNTKNPFEDGLPKPVVIVPQPVYKPEPPKPVPVIVPKPEPPPPPPPPPPVVLPDLVLQGVIVGEDMHQAIINDQVISLRGVIQGARVISVNKRGVGLLYEGKKFFLKVDE